MSRSSYNEAEPVSWIEMISTPFSSFQERLAASLCSRSGLKSELVLYHLRLHVPQAWCAQWIETASGATPGKAMYGGLKKRALSS